MIGAMDYAPLITAAATSHALPTDLVRAVADVESGLDPLAVRFEPAVYARLSLVRPVAPCSAETERWARAASWGLLQVMGVTARGLGFTGPYLSALCDPALGLEYGCRLLGRLAELYKARFDWPGVVAAYNAGAPRLAQDGKTFVNQDYVDKIKTALAGPWPV